MLAAVQTFPCLTTLGIAIPTAPCEPGSRAASPSNTDSMAAGVEGCGVGAEIRSPTRRPASRSTSPALIDEPPTSIPSSCRVMISSSKVVGSRKTHIALVAFVLVSHPDRRDHDARCDDEHHDGRQSIDVGADPKPDLGKDDHG